ncbi:MAG: septum formation protein Maf [Chitinivibrionales bacterium]|nr:septum formation protein Maf [Chitinivibrionales bacterium]MBD3394174.1 septum formation protein Maf [Chitinivibrionales bacterium]
MSVWSKLDRPLVLASNSPRRKDLLARMGFRFNTRAPHVDNEDAFFDGPVPAVAVRNLARAKALSVSAGLPASLVFAGDTVVCIDGRVMGKPVSRDDARHMLSRLSGCAHDVYSGIALACGDSRFAADGVARTTVVFRKLDREEIDAYLDEPEYADKAGAYAIQGRAMTFVDRIEGCFYNVVGLPVTETLKLFDAYRHRKEPLHD